MVNMVIVMILMKIILIIIGTKVIFRKSIFITIRKNMVLRIKQNTVYNSPKSIYVPVHQSYPYFHVFGRDSSIFSKYGKRPSRSNCKFPLK